MKLASKICLAAGILAVAFATTMQAEIMRTNVPFAFNVGESKFAAGVYEIRTDPQARRVLVQMVDGSASGWFPIRTSVELSGTYRPALVFNVYEEAYFLQGVRTLAGQSAHELYKSPAERRLAKREAAPSVTVIAAETR
jgi:hypothetical protein